MNNNNKQKFIVTFYDENEKVLGTYELFHDNLNNLLKEITGLFGVDDSRGYRTKDKKTYGYVSSFNCYGRFEIE